ncbi:hypothetical protein E1189_06995 [Sansalvadorimonas verongulae]|nr:hypothetical protein [Sansalvadorimonas verongulae]
MELPFKIRIRCILSRQCLERRIPNQETLKTEGAAWEEQRNSCLSKMEWRFTTKDARVKLKKLYPTYSVK